MGDERYETAEEEDVIGRELEESSTRSSRSEVREAGVDFRNKVSDWNIVIEQVRG